jgi:hypothetical protein
MPSTLSKPTVEIPTELVEDLTLSILGLEITDREEYINKIVPHGDIRFWLHQGGNLIAGISTWGKFFVLTSGRPFPTLFAAATFFVTPDCLATAKAAAVSQLTDRFNDAIDYM